MPEPGSPKQFPVEATGPQTPETETEIDQETEKSLDAFIEQIIQGAEKINEGNNGVILSIDSSKLPEEFIEILTKRGLEFPSNEQVIKILKIYREGYGRKEFETQRRAHEIISSSDQTDIAGVPKPLLFHELGITETRTRESLKRMGLTAIGDRVDLILMDRIEGDDLATILYREVIERHPKSRHLRGQSGTLSLEDLGGEIARILNFRIAGGKSQDESEREFERMKVSNQNADRLFTFLRKNGFRLNPKITMQITNALDAFHTSGLAFRDGHERNIMICGEDPSATAENPPRAFIVDFGNAVLFEGRYQDKRSELYQEGNRQLISDEYILSRLRSLSDPPEERGELREEITSLLERIESRRPQLLKDREIIAENAKEGNLDKALAKAFSEFETSQARTDLDLALVRLFVTFRDGLVGPEDLSSKLLEFAESITNIGYQRRITEFATLLLK